VTVPLCLLFFLFILSSLMLKTDWFRENVEDVFLFIWKSSVFFFLLLYHVWIVPDNRDRSKHVDVKDSRFFVNVKSIPELPSFSSSV
jgi:hypothetical protein